MHGDGDLELQLLPKRLHAKFLEATRHIQDLFDAFSARYFTSKVPARATNFRYEYRVVGGRHNCDLVCNVLGAIITRKNLEFGGVVPQVSI